MKTAGAKSAGRRLIRQKDSGRIAPLFEALPLSPVASFEMNFE